MTAVTLVMAYYENAQMLREYYRIIRALPRPIRDWLSVVIVDDGSPNNPAFVEELNGVSLQLYRIKVDVRWNQDAARNIGVAHAETNWVLMTDIDHIVPEETWRVVVTADLNERFVYQFGRVSAPELEPYKQHPNTWLLTKKQFDKIGGYDERFAGFYGTDGDFAVRLRNAYPVRQFKEVVIRVPRTVIADASTTTYLRKQPEDKPNIKRILQQREQTENWQTMRGCFPYERVHP